MKLEQVLAQLEGVKPAGKRQWVARCPAHEDRHASLSVGEGAEGKVLLRCHAGCHVEAIAGALRLELRDLMPEREKPAASRIVATYDYRDERGELLFQAVRKEPKAFAQRKPIAGGWEWRLNGVRRVPYRLPQVLGAAPEHPVFFVEGEKDVEALERLGLVATTTSAGANNFRFSLEATRAALHGRRVVILPDNDDAGRAYATEVATALAPVARVSVIHLAGLAPKGDVSDWIAGGGTRAQLEQLAATARVWGEREPGEDDEEAPKPRLGRRAIQLVDEILARANEPWVCLSLEGHEVARLRLGSVAMCMGSPGAGKSTLVAAMLVEHAKLHGPAGYLSLELDADELAARVVGMKCGASWEDVLRGKVQRENMVQALDLSRLVLLERQEATIEQLERLVAELREDFPGEPILVAVDYLQLAAGTGAEMRARVESVAEALRATAKRLRIVAIGVSQTSRAAGGALRSGELVGLETMTAGAESSAIERSAYVTLAIGAAGPEQPDGARPVELNIGKARFGGGDRVLPMYYNGRTGLWRIAGPAISAQEAAEFRNSAKNEIAVREARGTILAAAQQAPGPVSRMVLKAKAGKAKDVADTAIDELLAEGALVECERAYRSAARLIWTPANVAARAAKAQGQDVRIGGAP